MMKSGLLMLLLLLCTGSMHAQILKGVLTDENNERIPFAKIWVKSTSYGTISNGKGEYQLELEVPGVYLIRFSAQGYIEIEDSISVLEGENFYSVILKNPVQEIKEVSVTAVNKKGRGKALMKKVIDKRKTFLDASSRYACETYCFSNLDKRSTSKDSITDSSIVTIAKMNIVEWRAHSYYQAKGRYKDEIISFSDYTEKVNNHVSVEVSFSEDELGENGAPIETNPYIFINGSEDADINIFKNTITIPSISQRPLISPLAFNAFMYYNFYLEGSFYEDGERIGEVRVEPKFKEEALFRGTLYIRMESFQPASYEFAVNKGAMNYFKEMHLICNYANINGVPLPEKREFTYLIKEGKNFIHGNIRFSQSDYRFEYDDSSKRFWLETQVYLPEAFDKDSLYWSQVRPFHLEEEEKRFIFEQDSINQVLSSEEYLKKQDSTYNSLTVWDFLFNGVGFRNTFKKQEIWVNGLIDQVVPFGVGGYRHRLRGTYSKEFVNSHAIDISPRIDYGFRNKDLKGGIDVGYLYNPKRFSRINLEVGDDYDLVNSYESIQGTLSPANRVRNKKVKLTHTFEAFNGFYLRTSVNYSNRISIDNITYPDWVDLFGTFSEPKPFVDYATFMPEVEVSYRFRQKYILKGNKKIVTGTKWPKLSLLYRKGIAGVFGGQSDFDYLEFGVDDEMDLKQWGTSDFKMTAGSFLQKKDLRLIEHRYFRTSDRFFFSNPTSSLQRLDTSLSTSTLFLQANYIHHFKGVFLNKIWGINKLKLEETAGGSLLVIPEANFNQMELYAGIERVFRIKKQLFKLGAYAVAVNNNVEKASVQFKFGINFYDSFRRKWDY
ncbi:MAG: DUF5686 and carboxypeptidase regulatory-like domain-containing protein [Crocinitomicaceae bacterium]|nr:DUF5686 and carboxypeptidase regulatory-like domain-containing protein [Crocinitomicaceae bacterium]